MALDHILTVHGVARITRSNRRLKRWVSLQGIPGASLHTKGAFLTLQGGALLRRVISSVRSKLNPIVLQADLAGDRIANFLCETQKQIRS